MQTRRSFVGAFAGFGLALASAGPLMARNARAGRQGRHPTPRPGIDASRVLSADELEDSPRAARVFDQVRRIPQIIDGIRCHCGCADMKDHYSLLSCFEGEGMAQSCRMCLSQARLASELHEKGRTLDEIRAAIDKEYG